MLSFDWKFVALNNKTFLRLLFTVQLNTFLFQHKEQKEPSADLDSGSKNYFRIANHYKWALDKIFFEMRYETAIITEGYLANYFTFISYFC